jgi:hypothetical protein
MTIKARSTRILLAIFAILAFVSLAQASDMSWAGTYRFEGLLLDNPQLDASGTNKNYMLHHLVLQPKMVAADGVTIYSRFDIFNNQNLGADNQLGQFFGNGPNQSTPAATSGTTNVFSQSQQSEMLLVTQLYLQWAQEFGSLVVGRAPLQFGLGLTHNAGNGPFDHYFDTRDMVGYKVTTGNLYIMPILAKMNEGDLGDEDDVNDYILQVQYENPETDLALGVMAEWRNATFAGNDVGSSTAATPITDAASPFNGGQKTSGYKHRLINIFTTQKFGNFKFGIEAGLLSGDTGVQTAGGSMIRMNSYGIASELTYAKENARWDAGVRLGYASGDDQGTTDSFEGFAFDRNYDVAFMMFNHPMGSGDALRSGLWTGRATGKATNLPDNEVLSNAMYVSPRFTKHIGEKSSWGAAFTWAQAGEQATTASTSGTDLGYELDLNYSHRPYERMLWSTDVGLLMPGDAWIAGAAGAEAKFGYGIVTKAAISF